MSVLSIALRRATGIGCAIRAVASRRPRLTGRGRRSTAVRAREEGIRTERVRMCRLLHDSVVQTLEAIALGLDPAVTRAAARREADRLRRALSETAPVPTVSPVSAGSAGSAWRADQLREAMREALTNVVRHADADRADVSVHRGRHRLEVVIRDDGRGFDPDRCEPGFGLTESVVARLREVGGHAEVYSAPGAGTMVRMWVPR